MTHDDLPQVQPSEEALAAEREAIAERMHAEQVIEPASEELREQLTGLLARNHFVDLATAVLTGAARS